MNPENCIICSGPIVQDMCTRHAQHSVTTFLKKNAKNFLNLQSAYQSNQNIVLAVYHQRCIHSRPLNRPGSAPLHRQPPVFFNNRPMSAPSHLRSRELTSYSLESLKQLNKLCQTQLASPILKPAVNMPENNLQLVRPGSLEATGLSFDEKLDLITQQLLEIGDKENSAITKKMGKSFSRYAANYAAKSALSKIARPSVILPIAIGGYLMFGKHIEAPKVLAGIAVTAGISNIVGGFFHK